jgi:peptidoglycan hydrolase-like protein with peptidoglycan-binding domain
LSWRPARRPRPEPLNAIGAARIDCFEHFRQPFDGKAALLCYPPAAPSGQMQQCRLPTLRKGQHSGEPPVERLQFMLNFVSGVDDLDVDGIFGPKTEAAVRGFQQNENLSVGAGRRGHPRAIHQVGGRPTAASPASVLTRLTSRGAQDGDREPGRDRASIALYPGFDLGSDRRREPLDGLGDRQRTPFVDDTAGRPDPAGPLPACHPILYLHHQHDALSMDQVPGLARVRPSSDARHQAAPNDAERQRVGL